MRKPCHIWPTVNSRFQPNARLGEILFSKYLPCLCWIDTCNPLQENSTWENTIFKIPWPSLLNRQLQLTERNSNLGEYLHRLYWKLGRHLCTAPRRPPWNCDILMIKKMTWGESSQKKYQSWPEPHTGWSNKTVNCNISLTESKN